MWAAGQPRLGRARERHGESRSVREENGGVAPSGGSHTGAGRYTAVALPRPVAGRERRSRPDGGGGQGPPCGVDKSPRDRAAVPAPDGGAGREGRGEGGCQVRSPLRVRPLPKSGGAL